MYERGFGVGILVSQLPPSELARLKAELAETLISNFCYPRYYDYRIDSLRMRPVDRTKRQEVWQYLGSVDFTAWGRIDLMSPEFQRQVERLLIYFVQRNRAFFGEQGRKRMADIRMLINTSSISIVEGLRGHLTGKPNGFGNPRPVNSWLNSNVTKRSEPTWEQLLAPTMLLQQQIQEARGEIKAAQNDNRPNHISAKQSIRERSTANGNGASVIEHEATPNTTTMSHSSSNVEQQTFPSNNHSKTTNPLTSPIPTEIQPITANSSVDPQTDQEGHKLAIEAHADTSNMEQVDVAAEEANMLHNGTSEPAQNALAAPTVLQPQVLTKVQAVPPTDLVNAGSAGETALVSEEDVVIFQQMRHQLVVWTRIEAVRAGLDISGQEPAELLEQLQKLDGFDETSLQVTSTLIDLCDQIIASGQASLLEYKQAIMFYLMHTRSSR
jgi:hypothetical protein